MALRELSKKEVEERSKELAGACIALEKLQAKNKDARRQLKASEVDIELRISELSMEVNTGKEEVDDQVDAFDDKKPRKLAAVEEPEEEEDAEPDKH